jgi:hypothetical protein
MDRENLDPIRLSLFAANGVTQQAQELIKKHQIMLSTKKDLEALLTYMNLRYLPDLNKYIHNQV